jgi:hypothetical protein
MRRGSATIQPTLFDVMPEICGQEEIYPSVNIRERAHHLSTALTSVAHANMLGGFSEASSPDSRHRRGLEYRYDNVDVVAGRCEAKMPDHLQTAFDSFARACGKDALLAASIEVDAVDEFLQDEFSGFVKTYGGTAVSKTRTYDRRQYSRTANGQDARPVRASKPEDSNPRLEEVALVTPQEAAQHFSDLRQIVDNAKRNVA